MTRYITKIDDRLDRICYDYYGDTNDRIVEYVFDHNPGIELHGILLPAGLTIQLPDRPKAAQRVIEARPLIQIF